MRRTRPRAPWRALAGGIGATNVGTCAVRWEGQEKRPHLSARHVYPSGAVNRVRGRRRSEMGSSIKTCEFRSATEFQEPESSLNAPYLSSACFAGAALLAGIPWLAYIGTTKSPRCKNLVEGSQTPRFKKDVTNVASEWRTCGNLGIEAPRRARYGHAHGRSHLARASSSAWLVGLCDAAEVE